MTLGMQLRLWLRNASDPERRTTAIAVAIAAALLVASFMLRPDDDAATVVAGPLAGTAPGAVATGSAGAGALGPDGVPLDPATLGGTGGTAGVPTATGVPGAPGTTPGTVGGPDPSTAAPIELIASDRGVTPEEIRIGFAVANVGGLSGAGFALDIREDTPQYAQALADYVNNNGGVAGRRVTVAVRKTDPTSQSDQAASCRAMIDDFQVFGVVDVGSYSDTPAFDCIATQNQTPFVHNTIWGTDWLARSGGMEVGYPAAIDRISLTWARDLAAIGWLDGAPTVGIVGDKCVATEPALENFLKPAMLAAGAGKIVIATHDCDLQSVVGQPSSFVPQFRSQGVTKVLLTSNYVSAAVFMNAAQTQGYHPQYSVSDWFQLSQDTSAKNYPAAQFDGAIAITSNGLLLEQSGRAPYEGAALCSQIAVDAGLEPVDFNPRNAELWGMCDNFLLMIDGIKAAGPNPTRPGWAAAIQQQLPPRTSVVFGPASFGPGKVTGSDQVFTAQWQQGCRCYVAISDFRPAAA